MTRFRAGDSVRYGDYCGLVLRADLCGHSGQICRVQFGDTKLYIMADELSPVVEWLPVALRVVGGSDHNPDTLPSEITS